MLCVQAEQDCIIRRQVIHMLVLFPESVLSSSNDSPVLRKQFVEGLLG